MKMQRPPRHTFDSPVYDLWRNLIQKTTNPKNHAYRYWGAVGIRMCDEWRYNALAFINAVKALGYQKGKTVMIIDRKGQLESSNIKIVDLKSLRHERDLKPEINGFKIDVAETAKRCGVHPSTIYRRIKANWPLWELANKKARSKHLYKITKIERPHPLNPSVTITEHIRENKPKSKGNFSADFW